MPARCIRSGPGAALQARPPSARFRLDAGGQDWPPNDGCCRNRPFTVVHSTNRCISESAGHDQAVYDRNGRDPRINATVSLSAPVDIAHYMNALREHSPSRYRTLAEGYGSIPSADPHYYSIISPLTHASLNASPVMLIHGSDDMVAPKEHSEWMHAALVGHGRARVRLELIAGAGHFFESRFNGYLHARVVDLVIEWLDDTLS